MTQNSVESHVVAWFEDVLEQRDWRFGLTLVLISLTVFCGAIIPLKRGVEYSIASARAENATAMARTAKLVDRFGYKPREVAVY